jgi:hypothetical protein
VVFVYALPVGLKFKDISLKQNMTIFLKINKERKNKEKKRCTLYFARLLITLHRETPHNSFSKSNFTVAEVLH